MRSATLMVAMGGASPLFYEVTRNSQCHEMVTLCDIENRVVGILSGKQTPMRSATLMVAMGGASPLVYEVTRNSQCHEMVTLCDIENRVVGIFCCHLECYRCYGFYA
jgi:hypothetical protein